MTIQPLLDFIAAKESRGDPNVVWSGIRKADRPRRSLTEMTIREVLAWQDGIDAKYRSEAAGKYQILEDTLRGLWAEAGLSLDDKFSEANQDRLGAALLRRRGLNKYLSGTMTAEAFCNSLAQEWASLPCVSGPKKGRSFYDGDGLNKALVNVKPFLTLVQALRHNPPVRPDVEPVAPVAKKPAGKAVGIVAALALLAGAIVAKWNEILAWLSAPFGG